jgi:phage shock protein A
MGLFNRISDIISANVNDMIDQAEQPVKMAKQVIRELDNEILAMRSRIKSRKDSEARHKRQLEKAQEETSSWQARAERAVDDGNDDMARQALQRKHSFAEQASSAEASWWEASKEREELEKQLGEMEDQAQAARQRKERLMTKDRMSRGSSEFIAVPQDSPAQRADSTFAKMEVEDELKALKEKRKG